MLSRERELVKNLSFIRAIDISLRENSTHAVVMPRW